MREAIEEQGIITGPWEYTTVQSIMYFKTKRRRDDDNMLAWLKAYFDGIVEAGLAVDDDSEHMRKYTPEARVDKESPRVEMIITRMTKPLIQGVQDGGVRES